MVPILTPVNPLAHPFDTGNPSRFPCQSLRIVRSGNDLESERIVTYRHGAYHFTVSTLLLMGLNKAHRFPAFAAKLEKVWSKSDKDGWKDFKNREARNEATPKDLDGRIFQNCRVLQRTKDYGKPLLRAGAVIDLTRDEKGGLMICLNTRSKRPLKPGRAPKASKPKVKPAKPKTKTSRKASGSKKRARKASVKATEPNPTTAAVSETPKTAVTEESNKAN
jgi:hypothetical protein